METEILTKLAQSLNEQISITVKEALQKSVQKEVQKALSQAISDGEFYQTMTKDVQTGLGRLINEIIALKKEIEPETELSNTDSPTDIFNHTTDRLESIYQKTEDATFKVMDIVENQINLINDIRENDKIITSSNELNSFFNQLNENMFNILTELSFQDIIGQQIKKVIYFINRIEQLIRELYLSHNLMMKNKKENPDMDCDEIKKNVEEAISQENIDDLLAEYGL